MQTRELTTRPRDPFQALWQRFFDPWTDGSAEVAEGAALPRLNIGETEQAYQLTFELPGIEEKDIHVHVADRVLTLLAERRDERDTQNATWHRVEHRYGQLSRTVQLPKNASSNGIEALFKNGVLTVTVPKTAEAQRKTRRISIANGG